MKATRTYTMSARAGTVAATRERIARQAMALFLEHAYEDVTLAAIAKASGVSHQTVLNHFESKDGVVLAVAELLATETRSARYDAEPGDVAGAVRALVGDYERIGDANFRWAASERLQNLAELLDEARRSHQDWLVAMFGDRLPADAAARRRSVHALHAATDVYSWKLLRRDLGLSRSETEKTMAGLVAGVLEGTTR
jgi:AcrR family transcriptional regulator